MRKIFLLLIGIGMTIFSSTAQEIPADLPVITPENVSALKPVHEFKEVFEAIFTPDGSALLTIGRAQLQAVDLASGTVTDIVAPDPAYSLIAVSPDGRYIAFRTLNAENASRLGVWDTETQSIVAELMPPTSNIAFSADGSQVASQGGGVNLHNLVTGETTERAVQQSGGRFVAFTPEFLITTDDFDSKLLFYDVETLEKVKEWSLTQEIDGAEVKLSFDNLVLSADQSLLAIVTYSYDTMEKRFVQVWDMAEETMLWRVPFRTALNERPQVNDLTFSPDNQLLVLGIKDGSGFGGKGQIYAVETGEKLLDIETPTHILSVSFSPDGKLLVIGSRASFSATILAVGE